jgi:hypothetical protein
MFLTQVVVGGEVLDLRCGRFTPVKRVYQVTESIVKFKSLSFPHCCTVVLTYHIKDNLKLKLTQVRYWIRGEIPAEDRFYKRICWSDLSLTLHHDRDR